MQWIILRHLLWKLRVNNFIFMAHLSHIQMKMFSNLLYCCRLFFLHFSTALMSKCQSNHRQVEIFQWHFLNQNVISSTVFFLHFFIRFLSSILRFFARGCNRKFMDCIIFHPTRISNALKMSHTLLCAKV